MNKQEINKMYECKKCQGYGWWPIGLLASQGRFDAQMWGKKAIQCPWCKAGFVKEGDIYDFLVKQKLEELEE